MALFSVHLARSGLMAPFSPSLFFLQSVQEARKVLSSQKKRVRFLLQSVFFRCHSSSFFFCRSIFVWVTSLEASVEPAARLDRGGIESNRVWTFLGRWISFIKVELFGSNPKKNWIHTNNPENTFKNNQNISVLNISLISVGPMFSFLTLNSWRLKRFSALFFCNQRTCVCFPPSSNQSPPKEILNFNEILHLSLTKAHSQGTPCGPMWSLASASTIISQLLDHFLRFTSATFKVERAGEISVKEC